jgi:hypothetical protein
MTWGLLTLVNYIQNQPPSQPVSNNSTANLNNAANTSVQTNSNTNAAPAPVAPQNEVKVEFKALSEPVSLEATVDGKKASSTVAVESPQTFTGQQSVKLRYYRGFADKIQLTVNGKQITPPAAGKTNGIEFEINKDNIVNIMQSGQITAPSVAANSNTVADKISIANTNANR